MSIRGERIREKLRQEIRSRQIAEMMKIQRERALNECKEANIFQLLNRKIKQSAKSKLDMQLVQQLLSLLVKYPREENTYILIGNFLLTHPSLHSYFGYKVLGMSQIASKLDSYGWTVVIMLTRSQQLTSELLTEYDSSLCHILQSSNSDSLAKNLSLFHILLTFTPAEIGLLSSPKFCLKNTTNYFLNLLEKVDVKKQSNDIQYLIVAITHLICQNDLDKPMFKTHLAALMRVLGFGISDYCIYRSEFLDFVNKIGAFWLEQFEEFFGTPSGLTVINQLFYLYQNLTKQRMHILQIFQLFIQQFSYQKLLFLLNKGLHLTILQTFETRPQNPEDIAKSLQLLLMLLTKIKDKEDKAVLNKLLNSLEQNKFECYLEELLVERQEQAVEKILIEIIDQFYSQEVE